MSKMSEIAMEIEELVLTGSLSNDEIARYLDVPIKWVESTEEKMAGPGLHEAMVGIEE